MYGYIYLTTNKINNKKYIGQHKATKFNPNYKGSGRWLRNAIHKYGKANFDTVLLEECADKLSLDSREKYYISLYNAVVDNNYYNIAVGGSGAQVLFQTEETKRKISAANKGKKRTEEMNTRMRSRVSGTKAMNNGVIYKMVQPEEIEKYLLNGWKFGRLKIHYGRKESEETRQKKRETLSGRPHSAEWNAKMRKAKLEQKRHWYTNGKDNLLISDGATVPNGYARGKTVDESLSERIKESLRKRKLNKQVNQETV